MVQVIENWAFVVGTLGALVRGDGPGVTSVVDVQEVQDAEGWPNLLAQFTGQRLPVRVPDAAADAWREGARARVRARLGGPGIVWVGGSPEDIRTLD
jgi:hypothetical protein